jgi:plastocyanin
VIGDPIGPPGGPPEKIESHPRYFFPEGGNTYDGSTFVSSGSVGVGVPLPLEYKLTFPKAGTYPYICLLHAFPDPATGQLVGMVGEVVVQAAGSAYPKTQAQIDADAMKMMDEGEQKAREVESGVMAGMEMKVTENADGTTTYGVNVGFANEAPFLEYYRFWPKDIEIGIGDTVEWTMPVPGLHMVTFGGEPEFFTIEPQPDGAPKVFLNLQVLLPVGPSVHTGTGYYNSGQLSPPGTPDAPGSPMPVVTKYSLTFTQPGRFEYICPVHYVVGMDGAVNVRAGGGTPGMPTTGDGDNMWLLALAALGLAMASSGLAIRLSRNRI